MPYNIDDIKKLAKEDNIQWSGHVLVRLQQRGIKINDVIEAVLMGEIIEFYESDYPHPSCLIYGKVGQDDILHIVCSLGEGNVWMITAYYPNEIEWLEDFKTRRR